MGKFNNPYNINDFQWKIWTYLNSSFNFHCYVTILKSFPKQYIKFNKSTDNSTYCIYTASNLPIPIIRKSSGVTSPLYDNDITNLQYYLTYLRYETSPEKLKITTRLNKSYNGKLDISIDTETGGGWGTYCYFNETGTNEYIYEHEYPYPNKEYLDSDYWNINKDYEILLRFH